MKPDGVIAFHVTNRFLDLVPVVDGARATRTACRRSGSHDDGDDVLASRSDWVLLSKNTALLDESADRRRAPRRSCARPDWRLWTDDFNNLFQVLEVTAATLRECGATIGPACHAPHRNLHRSMIARPSLDRRPAPYQALVRPRRGRFIEAIDQRALPHAVVTVKIADADAAALAIRKMLVRGAPLIGAVGAYGLALALDRDSGDAALAQRARGARRNPADRRQSALGARPCPRRASRRLRSASAPTPHGREADAIGDEDVAINHAIGDARPRTVARHRAAARRADQCDDALQCRRARDVWLGHGDGAAVPRAAEGMPLHV